MSADADAGRAGALHTAATGSRLGAQRSVAGRPLSIRGHQCVASYAHGQRTTAPNLPDQGYAVVTRDWAAGDRVLLHLPMPVRRVRAAESVAADRGRIALQRGPIVFAGRMARQPAGPRTQFAAEG
jgi:hypothetical protein